LDKIFKIRLSGRERYSHALRSISNDKNCVLPFDDAEMFQRLCDKNIEVAAERDKIVKSLIILLGVLFVLTNNGDFEIPVWKVRLSEIPSLIPITLLFTSLGLVTVVIKFKDQMIYDEFINLFLKKKYKGKQIERDVIKASFLSESFVFKIYRYPYFLDSDDIFKLNNFGKLFNIIVGFMFSLLFAGLFIAPAAYAAYVSYYHIPSGTVGRFVSGASQLFILLSLTIMFSEFFKFTNTYEIGDWKFDEDNK